MLLKDVELMDRNRLIGIRGYVIIKRDGKHYSISIQKTHQFTPKDSAYYRLKCFKDMLGRFVAECDQIDEHYIIEGDPVREVAGIHGKMELWKEIKL